MRLICPDCGAQYEVPAHVIPDAGRDVQCSACGNTWFQSAEADLPAPDSASQESAGHETTPQDAPPQDRSPADTAPPEADLPQADSPMAEATRPAPALPVNLPPADEQGYDPEVEEDDAPTLRSNVPARRRLDPQIAAILKEEAEREQHARTTAASSPAPIAERHPEVPQPESKIDDAPEDTPADTEVPEIAPVMPQPSEATDAEQAHDATDLAASTAAEAAIVMPSTSLDALSQENEAPDGDNDQSDAFPELETQALETDVTDEESTTHATIDALDDTQDDHPTEDLPEDQQDPSVFLVSAPTSDPEASSDLAPLDTAPAHEMSTEQSLPLDRHTPDETAPLSEDTSSAAEETEPPSAMAAALAALDASTQSSDQEDEPQDAFAVADQPSLDTTADDISTTLADQDYDDARITKEDITLSTAAPRDDSDAASQRRSRLPDIEEMSQSWSIVDETDARADEEQALLISQTRRKSGFNFGFFTMIFVAIAAAMIYWRADDIIDYVPQMEPALDLYLDEVDALRGWVQRTARDIGLWTIDLANEIKAESAIEPE